MISFQHYWPALLLPGILYFWWVRVRTLTDLHPDQLRLGTALRSGLVLFLVLALMSPVLNREGNWTSVIYLLDVSSSVSPEGVSEAIEWIDTANREGNPDHARFIPFAANSLIFEDLDSLRNVTVTNVETTGAIDQSKTNIEAALDRAARSFAPGHLKRIVLLTDGIENMGALSHSILRMKQENVRVFTRPIATRTGNDVWVETITAPPNVTQDELFPVEVHVQSLVRTTGELEVRYSPEDFETREVALEPGINRFAFELRTDQTGPVIVEAEIRVEGDRFPDNNLFRTSVSIKGPPRVLYIEGRRESSDYLRTALDGDGIEVEVGAPEDLALQLAELDSYDAVILSDVDAESLTAAQMDILARYVRDLGGGFILAGGASVYGEDGYSETPIEEILPVRFDLERPSVALIIVLDKSGSMGGEKLELAKEASKAAVNVLRDDHLIGIVAFDYLHYWPVPLRTAEDRPEIDRFISRILAGGETNIYPALEEAYQELIGVEAEVKHVILLSDGRSLPEDFETLVTRMADASITVSTVAVGSGADRELLSEIATWGSGRTYFIEDAARVPQVFTDEAELATQGTLREESFRVILIKEIEAFKGIDFTQSPPLLGYVSTLAKDTAEVLLESDVEKPILARWQYGLGKTVAFTSDVKDRWSAEWLGWDGYTKLWPQLVRETMRRNDAGQLSMQLSKVGDRGRISITAIEDDDTFRSELNAQISIVDPEQNLSVLNLHHAGPGRFEAEFPVDRRGPYVVRLVGEDGGTAQILPYAYPEEYHFYPPDRDLLEEVSRVTGGGFNTQASDIFTSGEETVRRPTPLWPYLVVMALLLYLTDLLVRRLRLFEPRAVQDRAK